MKLCKKAALLLALGLLLTGCGAAQPESPENLPDVAPALIFSTLVEKASLPAMSDVAGELLEDNTGIAPDSYESAVYALVEVGIAPDELAIIRARDEDSAADIESKLESRLQYKVESAQLYLTEFQPMLQKGVVRRDGLVVSLLVSQQIKEILPLYDDLFS